RAGVQAELGVVLGGAALDEDVVADLPADPVAVVVARDETTEHELVAVLEEEAAAVVAVEVLVLLAVAVQRQVFDGGVGDVLPGDEGEDGHGDGVAQAPEVVTQGAVEFEALLGAGDEGALDVGVVALAVAAGAQGDAVADLESVGVFERDLLIVPVAVGGELGGGGRLLEQDG